MSLTRYLLEFSVCLALFYGLYHFLLRKETFFQLNRWYLLLSPALAMVIPFLNWEIPAEPEPGNWDQVIVPLVSDIQQQQNLIWESLGRTPTPAWSLTYLDLLLIIYAFGVWIMAYRLIKRTWSLLKLIGQSTQEHRSGYTVVQTRERLPAASFLSYIFWEDGPLNPERKKILEHELVHVRQWHSLDVLLMEIWVMLKWFHPLIYWYRNSLRLTHEYIADAYVSKANGSRLEYARLLTKTQTVGVNNHLLHQFNSSLKMRLLMLSKEQSEKWRYLKYMLIGPLLGVLFLLFSLNQAEPVVQTFDKAEAVLTKAVSQPVLSEIPVVGQEENYTLKWGDLECDCYTGKYPKLYYCEDKSLTPEGLQQLIHRNGGFQLTQSGQPQPIMELTAISKEMKDMGGFKGQFDEMGTAFNPKSPLWKQAVVGDVFRFTFKNGQADHFEFEVVLSDATEDFSFGERLLISQKTYDIINFKSHFDTYKRGALVEMSIENFQQLIHTPLRVQKDDQSYYTIRNIQLVNLGAMRSDKQPKVNHTSVDLSTMKSVLDAVPGDEILVNMDAVDDQSVSFRIRIKKDPNLDFTKRRIQIQWGDIILEKNQVFLLSKAEIDQLLDTDLYLLYNGRRYKVEKEAEMNSFYFHSNNIDPVKYQEVFRSILKKVRPGEKIIMGGMITEGDYVMPGFRIYIDYDWQDIFANHPGASYAKDRSSLTIKNAQPADLLRVLAMESFSPDPYIFEIDGVIYKSDKDILMELLDNQFPRETLVISRRSCVECPE